MQTDETGCAGRRRNEASFTLTEVMVAVVMMLLSLGLLLYTFVSSKRNVTLIQSKLTALQIAVNEAEQIQTNLFDNITSTNSTLTNSLVRYTLNRNVTTVSNRYHDIQIVLAWIPPGSAISQSLTNYITICNTN